MPQPMQLRDGFLEYIWDLVEFVGHDFSREDMFLDALASARAAVAAFHRPHWEPFTRERAAFFLNVMRAVFCESGAALLGRWDGGC